MVSLCWFSVVHTGQHLQITCKQWMLKENAENDRAEKCKINSHLHNIILYQRSWLKVLKFYAFILWPYIPSSFTPFLTDSWRVFFTQGLSHNSFLRAYKQTPTFTLSQGLLQSPTYRFPHHNSLSIKILPPSLLGLTEKPDRFLQLLLEPAPCCQPSVPKPNSM